MRTLEEIKELISERVDEVDIIDLLNLTTEDIVNAFEDRVEERLDIITSFLEI